MGSRYDDSRSSVDYRGYGFEGPGGGGARWDSERFARERQDRRGPPPAGPVLERERETTTFEFDRRFEDRYAPPGRPAERFDERYYREDTYGPPARRPERRYQDDDLYSEPRGPPVGGTMIPYRPQRPRSPEVFTRPSLLRRQSSLDTFDRRPARRYDYEDRDREYHRPRQPPVIPVPIPRARSPPRYARPRYAERDYEDIRIAEPEYYGDEEYRPAYREREWVRERSTRRSRSSSSSASSRKTEKPKEKTYPRKGKTRMPKRLVHAHVLFHLKYPFHEEGDMIIIEKALGKENIDEVVTLSREHREKEETTTISITKTPAEEEIIERKVTTVPISEAPESVRDWDNLRVEPSDTASSTSRRRAHSTRSRRVSRSRRSSSPREEVIKKTVILGAPRDDVVKKTIIREASPREEVVKKTIIRESSPSHRHRRASSTHGVEYVERRRVVDDDQDESNSIHVGPLALVLDRHPKSSDRDVREEIRSLELERKALRTERVEVRRPTRYVEEDTELVVARPIERERRVIIADNTEEEIIEVKKDKKAPEPRLIRAMMATLT